MSYSTDNFLVKNRDFVVAEHQLLLENSNEDFIKVLFPPEVDAEPTQVQPFKPLESPVASPAGCVGKAITVMCSAALQQQGAFIATSPLEPWFSNLSSGGSSKLQGKGGKIGQGYKFSSVASRFKRQLADLMDALHRMEPHYIRCIKPNSRNRCIAATSNWKHQRGQLIL